MSYTYREVKCCKCHHVFTWLKFSETRLYEYRLAGTNEVLGIAKCPECGTDMVVIPDALEGIPEESEGIVKTGIRGI